MDLNISGKTLRKIFLGIIGCIVLSWLLYKGLLFSAIKMIAGVLAPFAVGAALAFVLNVPMRCIEKLFKKVPKLAVRRAFSLTLTLILFAALIAGIIVLMLPQLGEAIESFAMQLPAFFEDVHDWLVGYLEKHPDLQEWVAKNTNFENMDWSALAQSVGSVLSNGMGNLVGSAFSAIVGVGYGIVNAVISFVFAIYCLLRKEVLARQGRRIVYSFLPERIGDEIIRILRMANSTFYKFVTGQCVEAVILGLMFGITMSILGMPYAWLISVIVGVTALVPVVGAIMGGFIGGFLILVAEPDLVLWYLAMFLILQQIEGNIIYPRVVGSSVGLPGMWVLVAVAVGGDLMGVGGMLLMVPVASLLYALGRKITDNRLEKRRIPIDKLQDQPTVIDWQKVKRKRKTHASQEETHD